jgi:hypothetical protein
MRPETKLLIACARTSLNPELSRSIETLAREVTEWPYVVRKAHEHGVRPLLFRNLNTVCPDIVPGPVLKQLLAFARENSARSLFLTAELIQLLNGLQGRGIPAIPFKGPALGAWVYGDPALRESNDLDILIPQRNVQEASQFLAARGYRRHLPGAGPAEADTNEKDPGRYYIFTHEQSGANLDLQPSLEAPHFSFALDRALWDRAVTRKLAGQPMLSFSPEDTLILLCVHGTKDEWAQLKWVCDIAELIDHDKEIRWNQILDQARRLRAKRKFLLGCLLGYQLLGAKLPDDILHHARGDRRVTASAERIIEQLFVDNRAFTDFERVALYFRMDDTPRDRMKRRLRYAMLYLRVLVAPSEDDLRFLRTAGWPSAAGYVVRPVRLIATYGTKPQRAVKVLREWFGSMN